MFRSSGTFAAVALVAQRSVVLVVEENPVFRAATTKRLRAVGFEVLEAANSAEADLILKSTPIDAVILPRQAEAVAA